MSKIIARIFRMSSFAAMLAVVVSLSIFTLPSFAATNAIAASPHIKQPNACYNPGQYGWAQNGNFTLSDHFSDSYCTTNSTISFSGYAIASQPDGNNMWKIDLTTSITAIRVSGFTFNVGSANSAGFSIAPSNVATHTQHGSNTWINQYSYNGVYANYFSTGNYNQTDSATFCYSSNNCLSTGHQISL